MPSDVTQIEQIVYTDPLLSLPHILMAAVLIIVGIFIGNAAKLLVMRLFRRVRVDDVLVATGAHRVMEKTGFALDTGAFIGTLLQWFIILFFIDIALNVLNLQAATDFLGGIVLTYLPRIFVAAGILFVAFVVAHVIQKTIVAEAEAAHIHGAKQLGRFSRYLILACAGLAVLIQLKIAAEMAMILFAGLVFASALAVGIAFGFGSKDVANRYIESLAKKKEQ